MSFDPKTAGSKIGLPPLCLFCNYSFIKDSVRCRCKLCVDKCGEAAVKFTEGVEWSELKRQTQAQGVTFAKSAGVIKWISKEGIEGNTARQLEKYLKK